MNSTVMYIYYFFFFCKQFLRPNNVSMFIYLLAFSNKCSMANAQKDLFKLKFSNTLYMCQNRKSIEIFGLMICKTAAKVF